MDISVCRSNVQLVQIFRNPSVTRRHPSHRQTHLCFNPDHYSLSHHYLTNYSEIRDSNLSITILLEELSPTNTALLHLTNQHHRSFTLSRAFKNYSTMTSDHCRAYYGTLSCLAILPPLIAPNSAPYNNTLEFCDAN